MKCNEWIWYYVERGTLYIVRVCAIGYHTLESIWVHYDMLMTTINDTDLLKCYVNIHPKRLLVVIGQTNSTSSLGYYIYYLKKNKNCN